MKGDRLGGIVGAEPHFRWRAHEVTRLEGFSDAVFAFSVTLLAVSLEVPKDFDELVAVMRGFPAFGVSFAILAYFWYAHVLYFRRFGLQTAYAAALNCALLFCLLSYIYPLKFLFSHLLGGDLPFPGIAIVPHEERVAFVIYGLGYVAVSLVFTLMYAYAWRLRAILELDECEQLLTRSSLGDHVALMVIGAVSVALALLLPDQQLGLAGFFYLVLGPYFTWAGMRRGRQLQRLVEAQAAKRQP
jgi:uncharacterized membrane protein